MPNKLVIDKSPYYKRCGVLLDGELHEIHIMPTGGESIEGNIFIGRIETISKGIDAAFVNIGKKDNAFLFVNEKSNIDELKCGQTVVVQALKDASKGKGVYITTNISFAGIYVVLFPDGNNAHVGVSARISDKYERKRLIELVRPFVPQNCSVIVRTGAAGMGDEIIKDLKLVISKMETTLKYADSIRPPALVYEEKPFLEKIIRDTLSYNFDEIIINDEAEYNKLTPIAESLQIKLSLYNGDVPLFDYYSLEGDITSILNKKVWLKSGAFLIIDETEALVAIDVNTGKSKKRESMGETLFYSNLEAAKEIPRQLRLRNLSGIIVIDFIDMKSEEKRLKVLDVLREECGKDRNKTIVVGFTELGLALITRKKTREPVSRTLLINCKCIGGRKYSQRYIASNIYAKALRRAQSLSGGKITIKASSEICLLLEEGANDIQQRFGCEVSVVETEFSGYGEHRVQ